MRLKKQVTIGIICLLLCLLAGLTACKGGFSNKKTYTAVAQTSEGEPLAGVAMKLYDKNGNEQGYVPEYSNSRGEAEFHSGKKDCYVQLLETPYGYKLDKEKKYTFDKNYKVAIVLEEGLNEDDLVAEEDEFIGEYVATVNNKKFATMEDARKEINKLSGDISVVLHQDITIAAEYYLTNGNGSTIVIDGAGHKITTTASANNIFCVNQSYGTVEFKNMNINHRATGALMRSGAAATVSFTNVNINTDGAEENNYFIFNMANTGTTGVLNLTNVQLKMNVPVAGKTDAAIIRTGNNGGDQAKTVELNITDSTLDATGAPARIGINIMDSTKATINIKNSTIKTGDACPIYCNYQPMTLENTTFTSQAAEYNADPIGEKGNIVSDKKSQANVLSTVAKIGDTEYGALVLAFMDANQATDDVVINLVADAKVGDSALNNKAGCNVTIDGGGHTLTSEGGNNAISIEQESGVVDIRNLKVVHKNTGAFLRHYGTCTVNLTDIKIDATQGEKYNYFLINLGKAADTLYMNMTRVDIKMAVETAGSERSGVIRTGNGSVDDTKTVVLTMTDCNIDATGATGRAGIVIMPTTTAYVSLANTTIKTKDMYPIRANGQNIEMIGCKLSCNSSLFKNKLIEDGKNVIQK